MEISNFKKKRNFESNLGNYNKCYTGLKELGEKSTVISNIEVMQDQFNELKATGRLVENDVKHGVLSGYITDASKYLSKADPNVQDIFEHYSMCSDFKMVVSSLTGGEGNV